MKYKCPHKVVKMTAGAVLKKLYQWRPHLKGGATVTATYYEGSDTTGKVLAKYWD